MSIAGFHEWASFARRQFVWSSVPAGFLHKNQRAVVGNKVVIEKVIGRIKTFGKEAPQPAATYFTAGARKTLNGALGVFLGGLADGGIDAYPITNSGDFPERHSCLCHSERARIHSQKNNFLFAVGSPTNVLLVRGPSVLEWVINMRYRFTKSQSIAGCAQFPRGGGYFLGDTHRPVLKRFRLINVNHMQLTGLIAAPHTPFNSDFSLNLDCVPKQAAHLVATGVKGAFVAGTTGESLSLTTTERIDLFHAWGEAAKESGITFIAHIGHNSLPDAQALAEAAYAAGAEAIGAMAPTFF